MKFKRRMKRAWLQMTNDRKQFGVFCGLLLVGLLLWARIIVIARPPRTAIADETVATTIASNIASDNHKATFPIWLDHEPNRNPFHVSNEAFPVETQSTDNVTVQAVNNGNDAEQQAISALQLEAIMGDLAMIDGRVIHVGDVVSTTSMTDPLTLVKVNRRSVIISAGDRRYELTIASPHR
ncbi:MAG: hypothetical protein H8E91_06550 [Planctomycetes bacterium]|nr:hypothetical protein [Planctomycetota bacterium]